MPKINIRIAFQKTGRAMYISHLDLMRVLQRAFYRAGLPLRYTEGYNPHVYLSVALPLPVGVESLCERADFGVVEPVDLEALPGELNALLPEGLAVTGAALAERAFAEIAYVRVSFRADTVCAPGRLRELFAAPVIVEKRTKKGPVKTDIAPMIRRIDFGGEPGAVTGDAVLCAQNPTLNPEYLEVAVREYADPEAAFSFVRRGLLDAEGMPFDAF